MTNAPKNTVLNDTPATSYPAWKPSIEYVHMKTRRAQFHLKALEDNLSRWMKSKPYSIAEKDDLEAVWHYFTITPHDISEDIPLAAGDFVNCLRSALDQLAWNLVNLFPETIPKDEKIARQIVFPI
jgi:hypothetical protein